MAGKKKNTTSAFERFAVAATSFSGSTPAFLIALGVIIAWVVTGPVFGYSDTWQLVINTGTTIITFLMVFLIQRSQNKDSKALHLKLNEIIASLDGPSNRLVNVEDITEKELDVLHRYYAKLAHLAGEEKDIHTSHSIKQAEAHHGRKYAKAAKS